KPGVTRRPSPRLKRRVALRSTRPTTHLSLHNETVRQRDSRARSAQQPRRHGGHGEIRYHNGRDGYAKDAKPPRSHRDPSGPWRVSFAPFELNFFSVISVPPW